MALNAATDFTDLWLLKGAGSPVSSQISGGRALTLAGSGTGPRFISAKRRRGAEFRSATFTATAPYCFLTAAATRADLYASSKVKSFTWIGWVRPNKTGVTSNALTVLGGVFTPGNMGATPWIFNQPCLLTTIGTEGSSRVIASVMGAILDTATATQSSGATSTAPLTDGDWNLVAVRVTGSTSTNNQVDAVSLVTISPTGQRRVYALAARRSAARVAFSGQPTANDTAVIGATTYTWKASLAGSKAAWTIVGDGTNPADTGTLTIGTKVYRFTTQVTPAAKAQAYIKWLQNPASGNGGWKLYIGGYTLTAINSGNVANVGDFKQGGSKDNDASGLNASLFNPPVSGTAYFKPPAAATSSVSDPSYTAANAGKAYNGTGAGARNFTTPSTDISVAYDSVNKKLTVIADVVGTDGNLIKIKTKDNPSATGSHPVVAVGNASGQAADNTEIAFQGGLSAPVAYGVKIGANWAATKASLIAAINASGVSGTDYTADIAADGVNGKVVASDPGGNDILLTAVQEGSAGNSLVVSEAATHITVSQTTTGSDGADANHVKIGATAQASWENLSSAINLTGSAGIDYGSPTTENADLDASISTGVLLLTGVASGTSGNGKAVSFSITGPSTAAVKDEFGDKTQTTSTGGSDAPPFAVAAGARPDGSDIRCLVGGWNQSAATTVGIAYGAVSDHGLANRVLTDSEVGEFAYTPPPTSARDIGWYRATSRVKVAAKSDLKSEWTKPVSLPTGATASRVHLPLYGSRHALRLYGVEAGRPWGVSALSMKVEPVGGMTRPGPKVLHFPYLAGGVQRNQPPPLVPLSAMYDLADMTFQNGVARRRRGYRILSADTAVTGYPSAIFDVTTADGDTYQIVFRGGTLYLYDNGTETELDTGWREDEIPTVAVVGNKALILSSARSKVFIAGSVSAIGVAAPTTAPAYTGTSAATVAGGVILSPPGVEYVQTNYDGTHNTDSGPGPSTIVVLKDNPNPLKVAFLLQAGPSGTTRRKLWRRKVGTVNFFLVATAEDNVATTPVYDLYDIPSAGETLEVYNGVAVTAEATDYTACGSHEGRAMLWGNPNDQTALLIGEVGDVERTYAFNLIRASGPIRGGISHEGRWILFTDRTVEVIEGDFVRSEIGLLGITKRVLDSSKGAFGPYAATSARGRVFWCDQNGVHTLGAGLDQKDVSVTVSWPVHPLVAQAVDTSGTTVSMAFNYVSQQLWVALTQAQTDTTTKNRAVLVLDLSRGIGEARWSPYGHSLSFITRSADGLLGQQFIGCGYNGEILELDVWDGDGVQVNVSWFPATIPTVVSIDTATKIVTVTGVTLPTTGLRGATVVWEHLAGTTTRFTRSLILATTASTITVDRLPSSLVALDLVHVGGIAAFLETAEPDSGTSDPKILRQVEVGLIEASRGDY